MPRPRKSSSAQPALPFDGPPAQGAIGAIEAWLDATNRHPALGVDEAGRGPLAGPVVAAAACLPVELPPALAGLDDSKRLSEARREALFLAVQTHALAYGVAIVDAPRIDTINILEATREAMRAAAHQAIDALGKAPTCLLVDGHLPLPGWPGEQWPLVKGDGRSLNIAAASILAKVTRDRIMVAADADWPGYGFAQHKGYGTKAHRVALSRMGPCPLHRASFKWKPVDEPG